MLNRPWVCPFFSFFVCFCFWWSHIFKGNNWQISAFEKNLNIWFFLDAIRVRPFKLFMIITLFGAAWPCLKVTGVSKIINFRLCVLDSCPVVIVWLLHTLKRSCSMCFVLTWCVFKGDNIYFLALLLNVIGISICSSCTVNNRKSRRIKLTWEMGAQFMTFFCSMKTLLMNCFSLIEQAWQWWAFKIGEGTGDWSGAFGSEGEGATCAGRVAADRQGPYPDQGAPYSLPQRE